MTTCRDIIVDAFGALGAIAFGGQPTADELDGALRALQAILIDLHNARPPLRDVDVSADYLASENERVRVAAGADIVVTLPNSVLVNGGDGANDYCFATVECTAPPQGSNAAADGRLLRPPCDGARVEIVGTAQALYFYRSDINSWVPAAPLTADGLSPLNGRYDGSIAALVAERLCDPMNVAPSPTLVKRIARGNATLLAGPATSRVRRQPLYL